MRYLLFACLLVGFFFKDYAQYPNWLWAKTADKNIYGEGWDIATDSKGNSYITGVLRGSQVLFGQDTLFSVGGDIHDNFFLTKYDSSGNVNWVRTAVFDTINYSVVSGQSVCTDRIGNIYVTGNFTSPDITIGSYTLLQDSGLGSEPFIVKYDENGSVKWLKKIIAGGTIFGGTPTETASDKYGNLYVIGIYGSSTITFDSITLHNSTGFDIFLVKYDSLGNLKWAKDFNSTQYSFGLFNIVGIATDTFSNIYITGSTGQNHRVIFETDTIYNSGRSFFLTKYDSDGNKLWVRASDSTANSIGTAVSTDANGNVYITGSYNGIFLIGSYSLNTTSSGGATFLAKYSSDGNIVWVKSAINAQPYALATDAVGNSFISGNMPYPIDFGSEQLMIPVGSTDPMFIAAYDSAGNFQCSAALQSGGDDQNSVSVDNLGNAYVTGDYTPNPMYIGSTSLSYDTTNAPFWGTEQIFIAKFNCSSINSVSLIANPQFALSISPNPFSSSLSISLQKETLQQIDFTVTDIIGQPVYTKHESNLSSTYTKTLDLSYLPAGVYFLEVIADGERSVKKLVKE